MKFSQLLLLFLMPLFCHAQYAGYDAIVTEGTWIDSRNNEEDGSTYIKIQGDQIEIYIEAYWDAGYDQYFQGKVRMIQNSMLIHVDRYVTISNNTDVVASYRNCADHRIQQMKLLSASEDLLLIEMVPGNSIYNHAGFFDDNPMIFQKSPSDKTVQKIQHLKFKLDEGRYVSKNCKD